MPGVTINRFCASGIDAVAQAVARIRGDDLELVAAGGVESGLETQRKAARAWDEGFFGRSLVPLTRPDGMVVDREAGHVLGDAHGALACFVRQGADGLDGLALAAHPEAGEIRHPAHGGDIAGAGRRGGAGADRQPGRGEADRGGAAGPDRRLGHGQWP